MLDFWLFCSADHITGSGRLKQAFNEAHQGSGNEIICKSILGEAGNEEAKADMKVKDGEVICVGTSVFLEARHTPGHTSGCHCFVLRQTKETDGKESNPIAVFTGDTVLTRGCGRTDFQGGSSETLYNSVHKKLFVLPDQTKVYPAHDYKGFLDSTIGEEKKFNPRLKKNLEDFKEIMANLNLAYPKKIDVSLPANKVCGLQK